MNTKITLVVTAIGLAAAGYSSSTTISAKPLLYIKQEA
jgi:hypothetical protein